jgi:hypothetical protein
MLDPSFNKKLESYPKFTMPLLFLAYATCMSLVGVAIKPFFAV